MVYLSPEGYRAPPSEDEGTISGPLVPTPPARHTGRAGKHSAASSSYWTVRMTLK